MGNYGILKIGKLEEDAMDRKKRIEYLITTMCVLVTSFIIFGLVGTMEPLKNHSRKELFLFFGLYGGFGFSMIASTVVLSARFFAKRKLGFKIVAALLWPITFACAFYAGFFIYIPYQIYNIVKIIVEPRKNDKDSQFIERKIAFEDLEKVFAVSVGKTACIEIEFMVSNGDKFSQCWMGKLYDKEIEQEAYWFGLTEDGMNAYDYTSFEEMSQATVFDGKSLKDVWNDVEIISVDGCDPKERVEYYSSIEGKDIDK